MLLASTSWVTMHGLAHLAAAAQLEGLGVSDSELEATAAMVGATLFMGLAAPAMRG
jgi:hypothetical protein